MTGHGLGGAVDEFADAGAEQDGSHQTRPGTKGVHDGGSGEVDESQFVEPALTHVPLPRAGNGIEDAGEDEREDDELTELDPFGHQARHDCGGGAGEGELEEKVHTGHQLAAGDHLRSDGRIEEQTSELEPARDHPAGVVHDLVTDEPVGRCRQAKHNQVLGQDVDGVLLAAEPGLDHGETGVHEDHQGGADQHEHVVGQEGRGQFGQLGRMGRQVEEAQAQQRDRDAGEPGQRAVGGQAADPAQQKAGGL